MTMMLTACLLVLLAALVCSEAYQVALPRLIRCGNRLFAEAGDKPDAVEKFEKEQVSKGLTHIKYNKYAPTPEEAANMTDEEFRRVIYTRMRAAEVERRKEQRGLWGGAVSDDYIDSLSRKKQ